MASGVDGSRVAAVCNAGSATSGRIVYAKQTIALLGVDSSTLWRWAKSGYLVPVEYGGQRRYRVADVQRILNGGRHAR